jgi:DNA-binding transcriptional MerR regulator
MLNLQAMIPQQLDLFGLPPKPPKKILSDDFAPAAENTADSEPDSTSLPETPAAPMALEMNEMALPATAFNQGEDGEAPYDDENDDTPDNSFFEGEEDALENDEPQPESQSSVSVVMPGTEDRRSLPPEIVLASQLNIPTDEELFKRQYYSMRETAAMFNLPQPLLRHWENEFDIVQPKKNKKGDRHFRPVDIKNLELIYHLLKIKKFTIDGAKEYLRHRNKALDTFELTQRLEKLKLFLLELKAHL